MQRLLYILIFSFFSTVKTMNVLFNLESVGQACPVPSCETDCPNGFVKDSRGCLTCEDFQSIQHALSNVVLQDHIRNLTIAVNNLKLRVQQYESNIEASRNWFFKKSEVFKGKRYYLSQQESISRSEEAMATCVLYGGYLVEIDDPDELNFVTSFIKQYSANNFKLVLTGGTDEAEEEAWKYRQSNTYAPSFLIRSRKLGNKYNCLYLYDDQSWYGIDDTCLYTGPSYPTRFICEIPELNNTFLP